MRAWFAGKFERCLELCDAVRDLDADRRSQLALLRARALLRLGRPADAQRVVGDAFVAHGTLDASLTAQLLLGAAEIRLGEADQGLARLDAAAAAAGGAHPTIRSEIALNRGLAHYARRDHVAAEQALREVAPESDIIHARALEYRGWIATAEGDHDAATALFVSAIARLDTCRQQDRFLAANVLQALSYLAVERFDAAAWSFIEERAERIDWTADGLAVPRYWIAMSGALAYESAGDVLRAFKFAREAEQLAPSDAFRAHALCRRAAIARRVGEVFTPADLLAQARELLEMVAPETLRGDERTVPLVLAEELANAGDVEGAWRFRRMYESLEPMERVAAMSADPRTTAYERMVDAAIADAAGERPVARRAFGDALRRFHELGYTRRAVACALRLAEITGHDRLYRYVVDNTVNVSPHFWARRMMGRRARFFSDPIVSKLTSTQREVLDLILHACSNAQIARARDRSLNTIKHTVSELLKAFGVRTRAELQVEAVRRHLGAMLDKDG